MQQIVLKHANVDLVRGRVRHAGGREERLTDLEVRLLSHLAERAGERVDRDELQREVWGHRTSLSTRAVDMAISRLRRKVEAGAEPEVLLTARGGGYRLVLPLRDDRQAHALSLLSMLDGPDSRRAAESLADVAAELAEGSLADRALSVELLAARQMLDGTWEQQVALLEQGIAELDPDPSVGRLRLMLGRAVANADFARGNAELEPLVAGDDRQLGGEALLTLA